MLNNKNKRLALSGIVCAISVTLLFIASFFPFLKVSFGALSGLFTALIALECSPRYSAIVFFISSILSFFLIPDKNIVLYYICFFGFYPILKILIDKIINKKIRLILKFLTFNFCLSLILSAFYFVFNISVNFISNTAGFLIPIILTVLNLVFYIYDYILSYIINIYKVKYRDKLFKN